MESRRRKVVRNKNNKQEMEKEEARRPGTSQGQKGKRQGGRSLHTSSVEMSTTLPPVHIAISSSIW
jgi:hypothetical protein